MADGTFLNGTLVTEKLTSLKDRCRASFFTKTLLVFESVDHRLRM